MSRTTVLVIYEDTEKFRPRYRAELWVNPFSGWMLASTRWVRTKTLAVRDGERVFGMKVTK